MPVLTREEEAVIQPIADKLGEQICQRLADTMGEILFLAGENERMSTIQQEMILPRSDEFLTAMDVAGILKISKALSCRMI